MLSNMKVSSISAKARQVLDIRCVLSAHSMYVFTFCKWATSKEKRECIDGHQNSYNLSDALLAARVVLAETRDARRVVLNLEQDEVERILGEVGGQQWRNTLPAE